MTGADAVESAINIIEQISSEFMKVDRSNKR